MNFYASAAALLALALPLITDVPGQPVTFDEALGLALEAPAVTGAAIAAKEQARAADAVSSLVANPTLTLQPGAARDPLDGEWSWIGEGTLTQGWNLSGLPGDRKAAVRAEGAQVSAEARAEALSHRLAAAQAWTELWAAQASLADAVQEAEVSRDFANRMARAAEAAAFTRAEASDAATYAAEARVAALAAEGEVVDRGFQLAVTMGKPAAKPMAAAGPLPRPPVPPRRDWSDLVDAAGKLPSVAALRLAADAARARDVEARSSKGWGLDTGVKATRDFLGTWGVQAVVGVTVPLFDRGEREAAPQAALAARAEGSHREAAAVAATELARALHEVEHSGEVLESIERELVPAAEENLKARKASLQAGETTVLELLVSGRVAAAARQKRNRAQAAHAWARVKVFLLLADVSQGGVQ